MSGKKWNPLPWRVEEVRSGLYPYIVKDADGFIMCDVKDGYHVGWLVEKVNRIAELVMAAVPHIYDFMYQAKEDAKVYRVTWKGEQAAMDYKECLAFLKDVRELVGRERFGKAFTDGGKWLDEEEG